MVEQQAAHKFQTHFNQKDTVLKFSLGWNYTGFE